MSYFFPIQVRFADTDAQGHVFFGNYFTYFDEALSSFMRALGWSYDAMRAQGLDMVYAHAECDYQRSAVFEELLHIYPRVVHIGNTSITFECEALRASNDELLARGKLTAVIRDLSTNNKTQVPDNFRAAVTRFHQEHG